MPDNDLSMAMLELKMAVDKFAAAFTAAVVRDLKSQVEILAAAYPPVPQDLAVVRLDKTVMACPNTAEHPRHVWSFPKSTQSRQCPGVPEGSPARPFFRGLPEEACLKTDAHAPHDWERAAEASTGTLGRHCRGSWGVPAERQCTDNLAHHVHVWWADAVNGREVKRGTPEAVKYGCPGLEVDREVQWCASRPYDHGAHEWSNPDVEAGTWFCKGFREVPVKRCPRGILNQHPAHNWDALDEGTTYACPGQGPMVPAGPDRHA